MSQYSVYWSVLPSTCDSRASVVCLLICSIQYMWLPCFSSLSTDLFYPAHVTPVLQYSVYWSVLPSTCDSRASVVCLLICSTQYMWLPCFSILSTDLFYPVHMTPVLQYPVYWSVLRSTCLIMLSIDLLYALHVAQVHWSAVCSICGSPSFSMPSTTVFQYVIHRSSVRITGDSTVSVYCLLIYCRQHRWQVFQYVVFW